MAINVEFYAKLRNKAKLESEIKDLSKKYGCHAMKTPKGYALSFCNMGMVTVNVTENKLSGSAQTNTAGAGFHAALVDFLCDLGDNTGMDMKIGDPTNYHLHKNFRRLKEEHMYAWLKSVLRMPLERPVPPTQYCMGYNISGFIPENIGGTIVTSMGRFSIASLKKRLAEKGLDDLANDFFVWNNYEKDARYSRNNAVYLLNMICCFKPSSRSEYDKNVNGAIINHLEAALKKDRTIPFPKAEYLEICELDGHEPLDTSDVPEMEHDYPFGYKKNDVCYRVGDLNFMLPGSFLSAPDRESGCMIYTNGDKDDRVTVRVKAVKGKEKPELDSEIFKDCTGPAVDFDCGAGRCRMGFMKSSDEKGKEFFTTVALVVCGYQASIVSISYADGERRKWAESTVRRMNALENNSEK